VRVCVLVCVVYICVFIFRVEEVCFYLIDSLGDFSVLIYRFACICFMFFTKIVLLTIKNLTN